MSETETKKEDSRPAKVKEDPNVRKVLNLLKHAKERGHTTIASMPNRDSAKHRMEFVDLD